MVKVKETKTSRNLGKEEPKMQLLYWSLWQREHVEEVEADREAETSRNLGAGGKAEAAETRTRTMVVEGRYPSPEWVIMKQVSDKGDEYAPKL